MSKNIKEIGKELMGKSLNSFHRKTGLTQLEKNNEIQDGILDGILSQVDDAYIEKTEQSNVIHLNGSGDGVVVLDSIKGNTERLLYTPVEPVKNGLVSLIDARKIDVDNRVIKDEISDNELVFHNFPQVKIQNDGLLVEGAGNNMPSTASLKYRNTFPKIRSLVITLNKLRDIQPSYLLDLRTQSDAYIYSNGTKGVNKIYIDGKEKSISMNNILNNQKSVVYIELPSDIENVTPSILSRYTRNEGMNAILHSVLIYDRVLTNNELQQIQDYEMSKSFELKSSFEEKINDEGKYEIEILSKTSKNLYNLKTVNFDWEFPTTPTTPTSQNNLNYHCCEYFDVSDLRNKRVYGALFREGILRNNSISFICFFDENNKRIGDRYGLPSNGYVVPSNAKLMSLMQYCGGNSKYWIDKDKYCISLQPFVFGEKLVEHKSNKIKLLINEPLRAVDMTKDKLCIKDGKITIERNLNEMILNGTETWRSYSIWNTENTMAFYGDYNYFSTINNYNPAKEYYSECLSDKFNYASYSKFNNLEDKEKIIMYGYSKNNTPCCSLQISINKSKLETLDTNGLTKWLQNNPLKVVYQLAEPIYEEVLNEYGEPIVLEGYENGTIYIDSTIVPTTTVRYTPKMESFKTLNEVTNNNVMLTNDINDAIIPYMMNIDLMIMEKEMALPSQINTRTMEVLDMTSMQKRTQDMLERLVKGKTLTEQQCKDRVVVYLNANKITSEQADELMILISEIYA